MIEEDLPPIGIKDIPKTLILMIIIAIISITMLIAILIYKII